MKNIFLVLLFTSSCFAAPLTVGNVPQVFTPTSLSNSPISIASATNVNVIGAANSYSITGTNSVNFGSTLNGIASNVVQRISGLTSDAQTQITANGAAIAANTANISANTASIVLLTSGLVTTSNRVETLNTAALAGLTTVSNGLTTVSNGLTTISNSLVVVTAGLVTTSNRVETVNGLNVKKAGDTMTGTLLVTGLTNSSLTASRAVATDANKASVSATTTAAELDFLSGVTSSVQNQLNGKQASFLVGTGLTNNGGTLSNNIVSGIGVVIASGANGQLTITSTNGNAIAGTVVNTGTPVINQIARYLDTTGTNIGPTLTAIDINGNITNLASIYSTNTVTTNSFQYTNGAVTLYKGGIGVTPTDGLTLTNNQIAASGAQQQSPSIHLGGQGWKTTATAASQPVDFIMYVLPVQGSTAPTATFTLASSINGGAYGSALTYSSAGVLANVSGSASFNSYISALDYTITSRGIFKADGSSVDGAMAINNSGNTARASILHQEKILAKTSNYTILALDSGTTFNNVGAAGSVNFTLPTAAIGLVYGFIVTDAQTFIITAGASTTIRIAGTASASAGNITTSTVGNTIRLVATSTTTWIAMSHEGTWTIN